MARCVAVNYHYVNSRKDGFYGGLNKTSFEQFSSQLRILMKEYRAVMPKEFEEMFYSGAIPENNMFLMTFDDGLKDHYENVFPVLKENNLKAGFSVPSALFEKKEVLLAHKNHILLASMGDKELIEKININLKEIAPDAYDKYKIDDKEKKDAEDPYLLQLKYKRDNVLIGNLKYTLLFMKTDLKEKILNKIFKEKYPDEEKIFDEFYMNRGELLEMVESGMAIIGHGSTHNNLSSLDEDGQKKEISVSKDLIKNIFGYEMTQFSYPYGGYSRTTIDLLKNYGFRCAFTVNARDVDFGASPFEISRYSTVDFFK
jgi:peptidoglycan/xylan/chitin deacetylase (PgdA/CDA1 family)